jgi:hypothetical protein
MAPQHHCVHRFLRVVWEEAREGRYVICEKEAFDDLVSAWDGNSFDFGSRLDVADERLNIEVEQEA